MSEVKAKNRVDAIDMLRGVFMCIITVGHALWNLDTSSAMAGRIEHGLGLLLTIGTPGFTMVSGTLFGYFMVVRSDMGPVLRMYRKRGILFFLTTHAILAMALYYSLTKGRMRFDEFFVRQWYITDTLGIIFIFFAPLIVRLTSRGRLIAGISLLAIAPFVMVGVWPDSDALLAVKELFFGVWPERRRVLIDTYPVMQLTGMFLVGTYIGERYARAQLTDTVDAFIRSLLLAIPLTFGLAAVMVGVWLSQKLELVGHSQYLQDVFYPNRLFTLYGFYLGLYLFLFAFWIRRCQLGRANTLVDRAFFLFGKVSLFTYVAQYLLVQTIPYAFGLERNLPLWGVGIVCAASFTFLYQAAYHWNALIKTK